MDTSENKQIHIILPEIVLQITISVRCAQNFMNCIAGAVISMLASSAVDSGFKP
jgi:hypothetical protein